MKIKLTTLLMVFATCLFVQCSKENKKWDSDYVIHNTLQEEISVYSSAYSYTQINGKQLVSFTDYISPGERFVLRNINAKEDAKIEAIFHEMRISKGNINSPVNPLQNELWLKQKVGDKKFEYTLRVDTTYFP